MAGYNKDTIRNIALIGHGGEGKTSLMEALLFEMKSIDRMGKVDDGSSVSDYDPEEISKKMSISMSIAYGIYKGYKINIIDTPGFFDFEGEMIAALKAVDAAIIVTGATGTLSVGTEKALEYCKEHKIPAMIYINGINKENSNYMATVEAIKAKYPILVAPIEIPVMDGYNMKGAASILHGKAYDLKLGEIDIPASIQSLVENSNAELQEAAAEASEELMEKFFEEGTLSGEDVAKGVKARIIGGEFVPIVGGAATLNLGTNLLLENIINLLPSPAEGKFGASIDSDKTSALVFKTVYDQFVGKLNIIKVVSGSVKPGITLYNTRAEDKERINQVYVIKGKKQESIDELVAGDIGALAKLSFTSTNDTLCDEGCEAIAPIEFPQPVISMAVYAAKEGEEEKIFGGLSKLHEEDPTFVVQKASDTGETVISGQGEAQLDILCKKLKNKFGVTANLQEPRISYRETIKGTATYVEGKHKKQSGGAGQFGVVYIDYEPGAADGVFEFVDKVVGGAVPRQFIPVVEKGLRDAIQHGVLAGYPVVNLKASLVDGKYHPVDSKEVAFLSAARLSFEAGLPMAKPVLLEPIMSVKVTIPESYLGDIMSDMNKRRGRIFGMDLVDGKQVVNGEAPMAELAKYATDLRSMTQGRGKFTMEFARYEEVPSMIADKVIAAAKK